MSASGLTGQAAAEALARYGPNRLEAEHRPPIALELLRRFRNPLVLLLAAAAAVSALTGEAASALIIVAIVAASVGLDFV